MSDQPYQLLPPLSAEEYAALRADISEYGIRVPVDVDELGQVLDGHHRRQIAAELGINCPVRVVAGLTEEEKRHHAVAVNAHRRMLTRQQRRELVAAELARDPSRSDRAIGRICGVDHKTVGAMRRGGWGIPRPEPVSDAERADYEIRLGDLEESIRSKLSALDQDILVALLSGKPVGEVVGFLATIQHGFEARFPDDEEFVSAVVRSILKPRIADVLAWPAGWYAEEAGREDDELREAYVRATGRVDDGTLTPRVQAAVAHAVRVAERVEQRGGRGGGDKRCTGCVLCDQDTTAHYLFGRPGRDLARYVYRDAHGVIYDRYLRLDDIPDDVLPLEQRKLPSGEMYYERRQPLAACGTGGCPVCASDGAA